MPTKAEIGMYDLNGDGVLDQRDVQLARQIGQNTIANAIEKIIGGGTVTGADMSGATSEITQAPTGAELTEVIEESLTPDFVIEPPPPPPPPPPTPAPYIATSLPSLPSISNVGSIAPTGVINWNAVPGGFQPLPQTVGGKKRLYQLSQFHGGINQRSSPRDISDQECQEATNITVSQVGRIKLLGDIKNTNNSITTDGIGTTDRGASGYGLFQFTAPASTDFTDATCDYNNDPTITHDDDGGKITAGMSVSGTGIPAGAYVASVTSNTEFELSASTTGGSVTNGTLTFLDPNQKIITLVPDGDRLDAVDSVQTVSGFLDYDGADNHDVSHVVYAAGNGIYACDANFYNASSSNSRLAQVYVSRPDIHGAIPIKAWDGASPGHGALILSPLHNSSNAANSVSKVATAWDSAYPTNVGSMNVLIEDNGATGTWAGTYLFFVSWLFDGGCETGLSGIGDEAGFATTGEACEFNVGIIHSPTNPLGGTSRIEGGRIYFKGPESTERFLLAEFSLMDGVKGALDSTYIPWDGAGQAFYNLNVDMAFVDPPSIYTYASLNGYYANEVYEESPDAAGTRPQAKDVRYRTAVVGSDGTVFIGNVIFDGKHMPDSMMFSMPGKPGLFPMYNRFDSPSSDGSPITALASFKDTILQFKHNSMYVINVSNPAQFYAQASFRDCGVANPCQVFTTSLGVIFANKNGCFIYDGQKVISLTSGKFDMVDWGIEEDSVVLENSDAANVPCVGYDPRSQSIIVLKDIGDDSTDTSSRIYNMTTQSWTEGSNSIVNANGNRHTNFIITSGGYLSILRDDSTSLFNYNHDKLVDTDAQTMHYQTKDLDFGLPSQTKKLFKVYVTFKGNPANVNVSWGEDGAALVNGSSGGSSVVDLPYDFTASGWSNSSTLSVATFTPDDANEAKGWKSMSLSFATGTSTVASTFEINDISILYRARPIK